MKNSTLLIVVLSFFLVGAKPPPPNCNSTIGQVDIPIDYFNWNGSTIPVEIYCSDGLPEFCNDQFTDDPLLPLVNPHTNWLRVSIQSLEPEVCAFVSFNDLVSLDQISCFQDNGYGVSRWPISILIGVKYQLDIRLVSTCTNCIGGSTVQGQWQQVVEVPADQLYTLVYLDFVQLVSC